MPRKAFVADLQAATGSTVSSRISELQTGDEDGSFEFTYTTLGADSQQVTVQVLVPGRQLLLVFPALAAVLVLGQRRRSG